MYQRSVVLFLSCLLLSCTHTVKHSRSFYYWKFSNKTEPDSIVRKEINKLGVDHFYIHYTDIDWSETMHMPVPIQYSGVNGPPVYREHGYTPVIFISNRVFERISDDWCDSLAKKLNRKIVDITGQNYSEVISDKVYALKIPYAADHDSRVDSFRRFFAQKELDSVAEIQIDCDWTAGTKDKYFRFLRKFKQQFPDKQLSATIRLYPYKYPKKTGVPPVDKGVLMCYNMGNINMQQTVNSVFDINELRKYLDADKYPLPLDIALPVFGWYAWFRGGQFKNLIYETPELVADSLFRSEGDNNYRVRADTVVQNKYLREGDVMRMEYPDSAAIMRAAEIVTKQVPDYNRIIFYHWNKPAVERYENTIRKVFDSY